MAETTIEHITQRRLERAAAEMGRASREGRMPDVGKIERGEPQEAYDDVVEKALVQRLKTHPLTDQSSFLAGCSAMKQHYT